MTRKVITWRKCLHEHICIQWVNTSNDHKLSHSAVASKSEIISFLFLQWHPQKVFIGEARWASNLMAVPLYEGGSHLLTTSVELIVKTTNVFIRQKQGQKQQSFTVCPLLSNLSQSCLIVSLLHLSWWKTIVCIHFLPPLFPLPLRCLPVGAWLAAL